MTNKLSASIIICTWNRCDSLRETLASLLAQKTLIDAEIEVIVVDNNSDDCTRDCIRHDALNWSLGDLRYIFEPKQGKQFALNTGIEHAKHDILVFTDDDVLFDENWLSRILKAFSECPEIELMGGRTLAIWPKSGIPIWYSDSMSAIVGAVDLGGIKLQPAPVDYAPSGGNMIARKSIFAAVGKYSESHFRHMDHEFGMRCQLRKRAIAYDPELIVFAPIDEKILTKRYFRKWAFKAGIANVEKENDIDIRRIFGIDRWLLRQFFQDVLLWAFTGWYKPKKEFFTLELRIFRNFGTISNNWRQYFLSKDHSAWIEKNSQKKNNNY